MTDETPVVISPPRSFQGYDILVWMKDNKEFFKGCGAFIIALLLSMLNGLDPSIVLKGAAVALLTMISKWLIDGGDFWQKKVVA